MITAQADLVHRVCVKLVRSELMNQLQKYMLAAHTAARVSDCTHASIFIAFNTSIHWLKDYL